MQSINTAKFSPILSKAGDYNTTVCANKYYIYISDTFLVFSDLSNISCQ